MAQSRITVSKEDYLKAILEAECEGEQVIAARLARSVDEQTHWTLLGFGVEGARTVLGALGSSLLTFIVFAFSILLLNVYWDFYYQYFSFPWARWAAIFNGILYGSVALLFWWLSSRLPIHPVITFCILAMIESVLEHLLGIYRMGILEKVPALQGADPLAVFAFAMPEYVLYWGGVLGLAALVQWLRARRAAV